MLNVSFSFLPGPGPGLCSCVVCGASLGAFALFLVLCALWATTREPILSSRFDEEDALLNRYLSTPVYVCAIRYHLQGARVIVAYTSMGGSQVVHIDAFFLEFLALPSFLFVQVVAIAAIMLVFDNLCSFKRQPQRHHFGSREDEHRGCGIDQFDDDFAFNDSESFHCMKVDYCKLQKFLSSTSSTLPAQSA